MLNYITTTISNFFNTFQIKDIVDILIVAVIIYNVFKIIRGTRAEQLSKGIIVILILTEISDAFEIYTFNWILNNLIQVGFLAILIVFQPELRRGLEFLGRASSFKTNFWLNRQGSNFVVQEIVDAMASLSRQKIGALIVIERTTGLNEIVDTGTKIDGIISTSLLINIFIPNTPLHDGAVIIKDDRVLAAACFLPLSDSQSISKELGTRHRAAIGMSEKSDSLSLIVSEETGSISMAEHGVLSRHLDLLTLEKILNDIYNPNDVHDKEIPIFKGSEDNDPKDNKK